MIELPSPFEVEAAGVRRRAKKAVGVQASKQEGERVLMGFNSATCFDIDEY